MEIIYNKTTNRIRAWNADSTVSYLKPRDDTEARIVLDINPPQAASDFYILSGATIIPNPLYVVPKVITLEDLDNRLKDLEGQFG